jgi:hypothetical protein
VWERTQRMVDNSPKEDIWPLNIRGLETYVSEIGC